MTAHAQPQPPPARTGQSSAQAAATAAAAMLYEPLVILLARVLPADVSGQTPIYVHLRPAHAAPGGSAAIAESAPRPAAADGGGDDDRRRTLRILRVQTESRHAAVVRVDTRRPLRGNYIFERVVSDLRLPCLTVGEELAPAATANVAHDLVDRLGLAKYVVDAVECDAPVARDLISGLDMEEAMERAAPQRAAAEAALRAKRQGIALDIQGRLAGSESHKAGDDAAVRDDAGVGAAHRSMLACLLDVMNCQQRFLSKESHSSAARDADGDDAAAKRADATVEDDAPTPVSKKGPMTEPEQEKDEAGQLPEEGPDQDEDEAGGGDSDEAPAAAEETAAAGLSGGHGDDGDDAPAAGAAAEEAVESPENDGGDDAVAVAAPVPRAATPPAAERSSAAAVEAATPAADAPAKLVPHSACPAHILAPCIGHTAPKLFGGRFRRGRKLGEGTFGEVCAAFDVPTAQWVVLKVLRRTAHTTGGLQNLITREVVAMRSFAHKNLLPILDVIYMPSGAVIFVFPLVSHDLGGLLHDVPMLGDPSRMRRLDAFAEGPTLLQRTAIVKGIWQQVVEAVQFLHENGAMHRDVKSSNVLVHRDGRVFLCDFGWTRIASAMARRDEEVQKRRRLTFPPCALNYRPFAIFCGQQRYTEAVDHYGLGCLLFEMLTVSHVPLFPGTSEAEVIESIIRIQGKPPKQPGADPRGDELKYPPSVDTASRRHAKPITVEQHCLDNGIVSAAAGRLIASLVQHTPTGEPAISLADVRKHDFMTEDPPPMLDVELRRHLPRDENVYHWVHKHRGHHHHHD